MLVVPAEVAGERARAVAAAGVGEAVCPFAQQCFEERFGFTVGLRPSGAGVAAGDAELCAGGRPSVRAVAVAVVAEDAFDGDAAVAVPAEGAAEEGDAIGGALARQQLCVGQARVVIDREVQVLPAGVTVAREPVAMDALADRPETAELLDVDVNELARPLALVADDRAPCRSRQASRAVRPRSAGPPSRTRAPPRSAARAPGTAGGADASAPAAGRRAPTSRPPGSGARAGNRWHGSHRRRPRPPADSLQQEHGKQDGNATRTRTSSVA